MKPRLEIEPFTCEGAGPGWTVRWRVTNPGPRPVRLLTAVQPHGQFRTDEQDVTRELAAGAATELALPVRFDETPGVVVENPFLIVRFADGSDEWRALARVRVTAGPRGEPVAAPSVALTMHRVGAAGG
jgi:hypothetical protein